VKVNISTNHDINQQTKKRKFRLQETIVSSSLCLNCNRLYVKEFQTPLDKYVEQINRQRINKFQKEMFTEL
jgi:hypothetical protein